MPPPLPDGALVFNLIQSLVAIPRLKNTALDNIVFMWTEGPLLVMHGDMRCCSMHSDGSLMLGNGAPGRVARPEQGYQTGTQEAQIAGSLVFTGTDKRMVIDNSNRSFHTRQSKYNNANTLATQPITRNNHWYSQVLFYMDLQLIQPIRLRMIQHLFL